MRPCGWAVVIVHRIYSGADALALREKHSGTKLERTSLSAGVFPESAYKIHKLHNSVYENQCFANAYRMLNYICIIKKKCHLLYHIFMKNVIILCSIMIFSIYEGVINHEYRTVLYPFHLPAA